MIAFGMDDSRCELDESLRDGWLRWMNSFGIGIINKGMVGWMDSCGIRNGWMKELDE